MSFHLVRQGPHCSSVGLQIILHPHNGSTWNSNLNPDSTWNSNLSLVFNLEFQFQWGFWEGVVIRNIAKKMDKEKPYKWYWDKLDVIGCKWEVVRRRYFLLTLIIKLVEICVHHSFPNYSSRKPITFLLCVITGVILLGIKRSVSINEYIILRLHEETASNQVYKAMLNLNSFIHEQSSADSLFPKALSLLMWSA